MFNLRHTASGSGDGEYAVLVLDISDGEAHSRARPSGGDAPKEPSKPPRSFFSRLRIWTHTECSTTTRQHVESSGNRMGRKGQHATARGWGSVHENSHLSVGPSEDAVGAAHPFQARKADPEALCHLLLWKPKIGLELLEGDRALGRHASACVRLAGNRA
jgi:hypothetical protein